MGKRGRNKDRLYIKASEYSDGLGGKKVTTSEGPRFLKLPFNHCALSLVEMENPVFTNDGWCYDKENILKHLEKNGSHPHTGEPLSTAGIHELKLQRCDSGKYECPITQKEFNDNSHIVANRKSGYAYSHDAVKEMNYKANNWTDLVDGSPLTKSDLITLQDPRNIKNAAERVAPRASKKEKKEKKAKKRKEPEIQEEQQPKWTSHPDGVPQHGGLTCSTAPARKSNKTVEKLDKILTAVQENDMIAEIALVTSLGPLVLELYCRCAPRTVYNFVKLTTSGYYNSTIFHRIIKGFMVQGGDPSGTGSGGRSFFGREFNDEIVGNKLRHTRGAISMANSGANSNGSQFFIVFNNALHLDGKHTVFGRLTSGEDTLSKIENVATKDEKPIDQITINSITVTKDPFCDLEHSLDPSTIAKKEAEAAERKKAGSEIRPWFSAPQPVLDRADDKEVGKYLKPPTSSKTASITNSTPVTKQPKTWNFSTW